MGENIVLCILLGSFKIYLVRFIKFRCFVEIFLGIGDVKGLVFLG